MIKLWGTLPQRRADQYRVCGIDGQLRGQQAHGQETTNALEPAGRAFVVADSDARAQWRLGRRVSSVVSGIPGVHAARFRVSLSDASLFVQSDDIHHPGCVSLT